MKKIILVLAMALCFATVGIAKPIEFRTGEITFSGWSYELYDMDQFISDLCARLQKIGLVVFVEGDQDSYLLKLYDPSQINSSGIIIVDTDIPLGKIALLRTEGSTFTIAASFFWEDAGDETLNPMLMMNDVKKVLRIINRAKRKQEGIW